MDYDDFLQGKSQVGSRHGFKPVFMPDGMFDFQTALSEWAILKGRSATFADCGLGKTLMQLVWAQNIVQKTNGRVLILTPLAVGAQTVREAAKFGIDAAVCRDGKLPESKIVVTNYERLHYFSPNDFEGVACDESGILKNFEGATKKAVTEFLRKMKYRSLWTATAAPNDYIELGTSSEALGDLGFVDMVSKFFKKSEKTSSRADEFKAGLYRFRGHAEHDFWRWVCSWARACRKPSDLGFSDEKFVLPKLETFEHVVQARSASPDFLFDMPAMTLEEQRRERRRTLAERVEKVAELVSAKDDTCVCWCYLNDEGDLMEKTIPGAVQISGKNSDEEKEEILEAFAAGQIKRLISKSMITGFGLNWQFCHWMTFFPSHSFEQYYQAVRRCYRFGQKNPVRVDMITSEGESRVLANFKRKQEATELMFARLIELMNNELKLTKFNNHKNKTTVPSWL